MNVGDIKYTFNDLKGHSQTVTIPAQVIRQGRKNGLSNKESIKEYLSHQGYDIDYKPLSSNKKTHNQARAKRTPNSQKVELINQLTSALEGKGEIEIVNPERQVRIKIDDKIYEFTLVQKRKG